VTRSVSFDFTATDKASAAAERLGRNLDELGRKVESAGGTVEIDADISRYQAKVAQLEAKRLKVDADTKAAERQLAILEAEAKTATGDRKIEVDADIDQARARLAMLSATRLVIDVDVNDANAKLDSVRRKRDATEQDSRRKFDLNLDVQGAVNGLSRVGAAVRNIRALAAPPVMITVGVVGTSIFDSLRAATPGMAGIGAMLAGSAGVAVGALSGIGDAVTALGEKDTSTAGKMQSNARAVASAVHGVELAQRSLRDAHRAVEDAQYGLVAANRDARDAEEELNDARGRAVEHLRDLQRREDDMRASRASAALSVLEAQERLQKVMVDPRASDTQRARATLDLVEARRRVKTLAEDEKQLKAEKADATKKGVNGSDEVQAALLRQESAARAVERATRAVKTAQEGVADAAWQVRDAQAAVREASQQAGTAGSASMNKLRDAMAGLTPEAQRFAKYLRGVIDGPIAEWRRTAQSAFLPGLQKGMEGFFANVPTLNSSIKTLGENLGNIMERVGPALGRAVDAFGRLAAKVSDKTWERFSGFIVGILDRFTAWADSKSPEDIERDLAQVGETLSDLRATAETTWRIIEVGMTVFRAIGSVVKGQFGAQVAVATPVIKGIATAFKETSTRVRGAWEAIKTDGRAAYVWTRNNVFDPTKAAVKKVGDAFGSARDAITRAWASIRDAAKKPVAFVVNTVMGGLVEKFNAISSRVGGPKLPVPHLKLAQGGIMPGYTPGKDVHRFYSPTAGMLDLSGGEAVMRPEFTRAVGGAKGVDTLNALARRGQLGEFMSGVPGFAGGGVLDFIKSKAASALDWVSDKTSRAYNTVTNPGDALSGLVKGIPGSGAITEMAAAAGNRLVSAAVARLTALWKSFKDVFDTSGVGVSDARGVAELTKWAQSKGFTVTSGYRPGSITASGNMSYHAAGRAIDMVPAAMSTFDAARRAFPDALELIFSPAGSRQLKNGQPHLYGGAVKAMHFNHVHLARSMGGTLPQFDKGGLLQPGLSTVYNGTGRPEPVLTSGQWDDVARVARVSGGGGDIHIHVTVPNAVIGNEHQVAKVITTTVRSAVNNGTLRFGSLSGRR